MPRTKAEPKVELRELRVDDLRGSAEAMALFEAHWDEVALNKRVMVLDPNWKRYYALEEQGMLLIIGLFAVQRPTASSGKVETLIGYSINFLLDHMHYAQLRMLQNDLLFIAPEWRRGRHGLRLILATEAAGREHGAMMMAWHAKDRPELTLKDLLPRMGYGVQDIIFTKEL